MVLRRKRILPSEPCSRSGGRNEDDEKLKIMMGKIPQIEKPNFGVQLVLISSAILTNNMRQIPQAQLLGALSLKGRHGQRLKWQSRPDRKTRDKLLFQVICLLNRRVSKSDGG
jgi:hypothetical protein